VAELGMLAATLVTACVVPQLVAVLRSTELGGVSVTGAMYATTSCVGWTLYAANAGLVEAAWSSAIGAALWGSISIVAGLRERRGPSPWVGVWAASIAGSAAGVGSDGLGLLLLLEAMVNTVPQALRARRDAAGVSPLTFLMMGAGASCWAVYGVTSGNAPLVASSAVKTVVCITIVGLLEARWAPSRQERNGLSAMDVRTRAIVVSARSTTC
jgi:uncharacterized protein with PQ loop repeat